MPNVLCAFCALVWLCGAKCVERYLVGNVGISNLTQREINSDSSEEGKQASSSAILWLFEDKFSGRVGALIF